MANVFNSVQGLHPKRNSFSAHTYRNDFTANLGVNIPVYIQEVPPATKVRCTASALVRLQALIAPIMDNIDYYVHFWKLPYRLIEDDRFTAFISGEIPPEDYDALFITPNKLVTEENVGIWDMILSNFEFDDNDDYIEVYEQIIGDGSLFDFCGYDRTLFPVYEYDALNDEFVIKQPGNTTDKLNWRSLIAYLMLHLHWYMNENVPYFDEFTEYTEKLVKEQDLYSLSLLLINCYSAFGSVMYPHGWEKDYFTSGLPNVQFGTPVTLPLGGIAPVDLVSESPSVIGILGTGETGSTGMPEFLLDDNMSSQEVLTAELINISGEADNRVNLQNQDGATVEEIQGRLVVRKKNNGFAYADLSEASAITINELRFANALQKFKERQMRFGRRRLEYYKGFFDVSPEDLRLQVPKYLGGGRIPINITDIEQTSKTDGSSALGHLAGKATAVAGGFAGFTTFCSEETLIIGIAFAMPHGTYARSLSRFKLKTNDPYDYFNPSFEHLGEQAITNVEIFAGANQPDKEFAYTPRYNEYRFHMNEMHGAFKNTLAYWTLGRIFNEQPALNADFVYMQPKNFNRIFAVEGEPPMLVSMIFRQRIVQPVSKYGTPMLLA